jgi:hypothetical protein
MQFHWSHRFNFYIIVDHISTKFYYTVGGKVSLAGLSLDPPIILEVNFLYCFHDTTITVILIGGIWYPRLQANLTDS